MDALNQRAEPVLREYHPTVRAWLGRDLHRRYDAIVREDLPQDMLDLLADRVTQD